MAKRTYYRDAKGRFASKGTPGAKAVTVDVDREKKRIKKELNSKQRNKLEEVLSRKQLKGKALTQVKKELEGMNLSELRKLTQKVGAKQPERYRNRKDAWRQAILEKVSKPEKSNPNLGSKERNLAKKTWVDKQVTNKRIPENVRSFLKKYKNEDWLKPYPVDGMGFEVNDWKKQALTEANRGYKASVLISKGKDYANKITKPNTKEQNKIAKLEEDLLALRKDMISKGFEHKDFNAKAEKLLLMEKELYSLQSASGLNEYQKVIDSIRQQSRITRAEAEALANGIRIETSVEDGVIPNLRKDAADFYELTGGRGSATLQRFERLEDRAHANYGFINIGQYDRETIYHEMGHHMEFSSRGMLNAAVSLRTDLATGDKPVQLEGYDKSEKAIPGKYISPYVGKVYLNSYTSADVATEVTSMGIQYFSDAKSLKHFAEKSPEHYHYMIGVLTNYEVNFD